MNWLRRLLFLCVLPALWVAGAGMALIDAGQFLVIFHEDRFGTDLVAGCLLAGVAVLGALFWSSRIRGLKTDAGVIRHCYWLLVAVLLGKIAWCCWLDSAQPNDMGRYWRYGQLLANGSREELISDGMFCLGVFVRRAFFYTAPIFRFVGAEQRHLEIVNVALQMGTLWMLFLWGRSAIGLKATAVGLPWYVLYPDWWFAPTLASHDIPAMLMVSCLLWAVEGLRREICRFRAEGASGYARLMFYCVLAGVCTSYLHMVRDFGSIMLLTGMLGTVFYFWGYGNFRTLWAGPFTLRSQELAVAQCLVLFCLVYLGTNRLLLFVEEIPELQESSVLGISHLTSSVGTDEDGVFWTLAPWFLQYSPALPGSERTEVFTRKLLWEKLGKGLHFWPHVYRKKQVLAYSSRTMEYALGGIGGDAWFRSDLTHLASLRVFCSLIYGYFALLFLIRLLIIFKFPPQPGEIVSLILAFGFLSPLLLATEAQHAYDQLLAMPMGAAVGVLSVGVTKPLGIGRPSLWKRRLLVGSGCLTLVVGLQALLGALVNARGLTFATFDQVGCRRGEFAVSPERLSVDLYQRPGDTNGATDLADVEFQLSGQSLEDGVLKFFVSSDHHRQQLMNRLNWGDCPWTWEILVDGTVVRSGFVRDLSRPVLTDVALPVAGQQSVRCRLVVRGDSEWKAEFAGSEDFGIVPRPRIAMEYCY